MSNFVDEAALCVKAGDGGAGCVSFRREAHTPKGGPDGGDGGSGGNVWLVADRNVASLLAFRDHPHRRAVSGTHGSGQKRHGSSGNDLLVYVPEGTIVKDREGETLADLVHQGDRWLAARAGVGGKGNTRFMGNRRRAPGFAEQGEVGEERWVWLELKLMADVALVGFPNVGKSTLIASMSAAKPKIADYPFTTLVPNLGVVRTDDGFEMVLADIPGLIEGAAEGRGLGHQFLRHIERARVLLLVLDLAPPDGVGVEEQERVLLNELEQYQPDLLERERVRVFTRADLVSAEDLPDLEGSVVSAVTGQGLGPLVGVLRGATERARAALPDPEAYVVHTPSPEGINVAREHDGSYSVHGRDALRAVAVNDLTNAEALDYVHERLSALGVDRALARAGARTGDQVRIGTMSFEYEAADEINFADQSTRRSASKRKGSRG
ncbi:MAG TPA: GTPase ObgE [Acidimicrobiaceae bacterium]|jgi:GTP-binding protein|nr:GTPase ObgE [Acidimicrobiaceae bacterium]